MHKYDTLLLSSPLLQFDCCEQLTAQACASQLLLFNGSLQLVQAYGQSSVFKKNKLKRKLLVNKEVSGSCTAGSLLFLLFSKAPMLISSGELAMSFCEDPEASGLDIWVGSVAYQFGRLAEFGSGAVFLVVRSSIGLQRSQLFLGWSWAVLRAGRGQSQAGFHRFVPLLGCCYLLQAKSDHVGWEPANDA